MSFDFSTAPRLNGRWRSDSNGDEEVIVDGVVDATFRCLQCPEHLSFVRVF